MNNMVDTAVGLIVSYFEERRRTAIVRFGSDIRTAIAQREELQGVPHKKIAMLAQNRLFIVIEKDKYWYVFATVYDPNPSFQAVFLEPRVDYAHVSSYVKSIPGVISVHFYCGLEISHLRTKEARQFYLDLYVDGYFARWDTSDMVKAPPGYEPLQPLLDKFRGDHPAYDKNVFLIMRFRSEPYFDQIQKAIVDNLARHGLRCVRADSKTYPSDGDLWNNVCVYMMGCKYGVSVYEDIDEREFAANVALEYGFMRALDKQVLLLREKRLPSMPADIMGKLYRAFDSRDIDASIARVIDDWVKKDLHLT